MEAKYLELARFYQGNPLWFQPSTFTQCNVMSNVAARKSTLEKIAQYANNTINTLKENGAPQAEVKKWTDISAAVMELSTTDLPTEKTLIISAAMKSHVEMLEKQIDKAEERDLFLLNHLYTAQNCLQMSTIKDAFLKSMDSTVIDARSVDIINCIQNSEIRDAETSQEARRDLLQRIIIINETNRLGNNPQITVKLKEWAERLLQCNEENSIQNFRPAIEPLRNLKAWCSEKFEARKSKMLEAFPRTADIFTGNFSYHVSLRSQLDGLEACVRGISDAATLR